MCLVMMAKEEKQTKRKKSGNSIFQVSKVVASKKLKEKIVNK